MKPQAPRRLAVTGASGMLGRSVALEARRRGYEVVGFFHSVVPSIPGVKTVRMDVRNAQNVDHALMSVHPDVIVHAAAEVRVDWCEDHPGEAERTNRDGSRNLAVVAAKCGSTFLYVSTDSVFPGDRGNYSEEDQPGPLNVYARTKLAGEDAVLDVLPGAVVARTNFYGVGGRHRRGLLGWVVNELNHRRTLPGFTDVVFSPAPVKAVAEALVDLLDPAYAGRIHVVGSESISKYQFARKVAAKLGHDMDLVRPARLADQDLRAPRPLDTSLNADKLNLTLGRTLPSVDEGLTATFREFRARGMAIRRTDDETRQ